MVPCVIIKVTKKGGATMSIESMMRDFVITDPEACERLLRDMEDVSYRQEHKLEHPTSLEIGEELLKEFWCR